MVRRALAVAFALLIAPAAARAQADLFSRETLHGVADLRVVAGDVARDWTDGGAGKSAAPGSSNVGLSRAAVVWTPSVGVWLRAHAAAQYEPQASPRIDLQEAYVDLTAPPLPAAKLSARVGVFYPPVSLEHTGIAWSTPDMLSGSAINTWIGEEVLVRGIELTARRDLGEHEVAATAAVFGWNDTAGTLLAFRGWALHGLTTGRDTRWALPPLSPFMKVRQFARTTPVLELDHRAGYYGRLEWRPPAPVTLSAIYYDNAGNRVAVDADKQWAWETRFFNAGLEWEVDPRTRVLAQVMNGETLMGFRQQGKIWIDVGYRAGYVLVRRKLGEDAVSGRVDLFRTTDRTLQALDDNREHGWAATAAWRHRLNGHLDVIVEG